MKVKICGLRRAEDAVLALELGADYLGIVLAEDSPRCATRDQASRIVRLATNRAPVVLVFRGQDDASVVDASQSLGVRRVQVHGADAVRCARLASMGLLPIPVHAVASDAQVLPAFGQAPSVEQPALLDGGRGGAGTQFAWSLLGDRAPHAVLIAGGLNPDNVSELLRLTPWGIDVSSGIEREPGVKDVKLMKQLFEIVRTAEVRK